MKAVGRSPFAVGRGEGSTANSQRPTAYELIVIGCSSGGMQALQKILCALPADFVTPIAVAQHRHKTSDDALPDYFRRTCKIKVEDVEDKQWIKPATIYFAPSDYHLMVARGEFALSVDDPVRHSRPSIDVLFESAADAYGSSLIAVILTGANEDGAEGVRKVKDRGGLVVAQEPKTARAPAMPTAAIATGSVDQILRLEEIAPFLVESCRLALARP